MMIKIPELEPFKKIDTIDDLVRLASFVFSTISHSQESSQLDIEKSVEENFYSFKTHEIFGWCHTNALFYHTLLNLYDRDSYIYDYGLQKYKFTHVVVIVTLREDQYLIDPYFNRFYSDRHKNPLTFKELKDLIKNSPNSIQSKYGKGVKKVYQEYSKDFVDFTGEKLEKSVINSWKVLSDFETEMKKIYGDTNPLLLIPNKISRTKILKKLDNTSYFEFF